MALIQRRFSGEINFEFTYFTKFYFRSKLETTYGNYYRIGAIGGTSGRNVCSQAERAQEKQGATGAANRKALRYFKKRGNKRGEWMKERTRNKIKQGTETLYSLFLKSLL